MQQISAPYIANLYEYGSFHGIQETQLRQFLDNKTLDVCLPTNLINPHEFETTFSELYQLTKDKYLGLNLGSFLNLKALGLAYQVSLESSDLKQCLVLIQEYFKYSFPIIQLEANEYEDAFEIKLNCSLIDEQLKIQLLDAIICFMYREIRQLTTDAFSPQLFSPQTYLDEYIKRLNTKVQQGTAYIVRFNKAVNDIPINQNRIKQLEILLPKFLQLLDKKIPQYGDFSIRVRKMILNLCNPQLPNLEQVCKQFLMSNRSFQRKLSKETQSYRKIADQIKQELAHYLSQGNQIKTKDIAYILGYSEPSAYLHAAKRWKEESR